MWSDHWHDEVCFWVFLSCFLSASFRFLLLARWKVSPVWFATGNSLTGSFYNRFNLFLEGLDWFSWARLVAWKKSLLHLAVELVSGSFSNIIVNIFFGSFYASKLMQARFVGSTTSEPFVSTVSLRCFCCISYSLFGSFSDKSCLSELLQPFLEYLDTTINCLEKSIQSCCCVYNLQLIIKFQ